MTRWVGGGGVAVGGRRHRGVRGARPGHRYGLPDLYHRLARTPARNGTTGRVLVVFPGFAMPGDLLSEAFAPYLPADDAMIVIGYAECGVDVAAISAAVEAELVRLAPREVVVYGASMGGMVAREFLRPHEGPVVLASTPPRARPTGRPGRRRCSRSPGPTPAGRCRRWRWRWPCGSRAGRRPTGGGSGADPARPVGRWLGRHAGADQPGHVHPGLRAAARRRTGAEGAAGRVPAGSRTGAGSVGRRRGLDHGLAPGRAVTHRSDAARARGGLAHPADRAPPRRRWPPSSVLEPPRYVRGNQFRTNQGAFEGWKTSSARVDARAKTVFSAGSMRAKQCLAG